MKAIKAPVLLAALAANVDAVKTQDKTITKVVKLLQSMLEKSKEDGEDDRKLYAKFKCYCDDNEEEKRASIASLTTQIDILTSKIEETQGSTGKLSSQCAKLKSELFDNEQAQATAESVRGKEHEAFVGEENDMVAAIGQMDDAISTLASVGADQSLGDAAGFLQQSQKSKVQRALSVVSALLTPAQQQQVKSFVQEPFAAIQAPFTGTYTSQSGQVVGILKNMRDTFKQNLANARATEKAQLDSHTKLMSELQAEHTRMTKSYDDKQEELGNNDDNLSDFKEQLTEAKTQKASDEEFLQKLLATCEEKAKQYQERCALRTNEEAAIAEAIAILNSDEAFSTFGKQDATSTGATSFMQMKSVHAHNPAALLQSGATAKARMQAKDLLMKAAGKHHSMKLSKVAFLLQKGNPFETVLKEITKMIKLIEEEGKTDKENLDWCNTERTENDATLSDKNDEIFNLESELNELDTAIEDPESGLKKQIEQTEESLKETVEAQKTQTGARKEANLDYQANIKNLVKAEEILTRAVKVLKKYYEALEEKIAAEEGAGFLQKEDPAPPSTFGTFEGQSDAGGDAINMIEFILEETKKEEGEAHADEEMAQHDYEDDMADLKEQEEENQKTLVELRETLAEKEKTRDQKKQELKETTKDKEAVEEYLAKIKPGCDFISENFDTRETSRATETAALENAQTLLKDTPAYKAAKAEEHEESLGECKDQCEDEDHVDCKACLAGTSVPGYCAGHAGTPGC